MTGHLLFISGQEIFVAFLVFLLLFGSKKVPELARGLGKGMKEFRKATEDIKKELNDTTSDLKKDFSDIKNNIDNHTKI